MHIHVVKDMIVSVKINDSATKMCTKIVSNGDHRSTETVTFGKIPPCTCPTLVAWIIARNVYGCQIMWVVIPHIEIICHGSQICVSFVE